MRWRTRDDDEHEDEYEHEDEHDHEGRSSDLCHLSSVLCLLLFDTPKKIFIFTQ
jgi:hypothetical protein